MTSVLLSDNVRETLHHFLGAQPSALEVGGDILIAGGRRVRALPAALPFPDATFDRLYCINALNQFPDRLAFFAEARRVLKPGGGLLTIDMDPHTDRDEFSEEYLVETGAIDRERFARVRTLRGELALSGFDWTESMEADHVELVSPAADYRLYATVGWLTSAAP